MPNKQAILPLLDDLAPAAKLAGAVNTVVNDHGKLTGYTTDGIGFMQALAAENIDLRGEKMVLAGAGGAGTPIAIQAALDGVKDIVIVNRATDPQYHQALKNVKIINEQTNAHARFVPLADQAQFKAELADATIYCDATGVGMKPLADQSLITDPSWLREDLIVYDTVYAPRTTKLMTIAQAAGVRHVFDGLGMMLYQGAEAFQLWTGQAMPVQAIADLLFNEKD